MMQAWHQAWHTLSGRFMPAILGPFHLRTLGSQTEGTEEPGPSKNVWSEHSEDVLAVAPNLPVSSGRLDARCGPSWWGLTLGSPQEAAEHTSPAH